MKRILSILLKRFNICNRWRGLMLLGRDVHVGDTIIGIKGRVGFEAAAPMVIIKSHHALEKHVLTKVAIEY